MRFLKTSVIILLISLLAIPCFAEVPKLIEYCGTLAKIKTSGKFTKETPYPPGYYDINFHICTNEMCTEIIWAEKHCDVPITWSNRGEYCVNLGEFTSLAELDFNQDYWLLITEDTKGYSKVEQLLSDPYGMRSEWANMAVTVYDSETGEYKNLQDIVINEAANADTLDGRHYMDIANEIDADIAVHTAIPNAHHTKTTLFSELTDTATDAQIPNDITIDYAAEAGNADTVDGAHAAALEESAEIVQKIADHTAVSDAHHTKTTLFSELTDTATDAQIPDDITILNATNADTVDGMHYVDITDKITADISAHSGDSNAHHTKTTLFSELSDTATDAQIPDDITINVARGVRAQCTLPEVGSAVAGEMVLVTCPVGEEELYVFTGTEWKPLEWAP